MIRSLSGSDSRVDVILDAAGQVFADHGVDAASMAQIARASSLSKPALYHYFDGKDALVAALVARLFEDDAETVARARASTAKASVVLNTYAVDLAELLGRHAYLARVLAEFCARASRDPHLRDIVGGAYERYVTTFEAVVRRGVTTGEFSGATDPARAAFALVALIEGSILVAQATGRDLTDALTASVAAFVGALSA